MRSRFNKRPIDSALIGDQLSIKVSSIARAIRTQLYGLSNNNLRMQAKLMFSALLLGAAPAAQAANYTWLGGNGNWSNSNWSVSGFPNAAASNVFIDGGNSINSAVNLDTSASIGTLNINAGDSLSLLNGTSLNVNGGLITNNGTMSLNASNATTTLLLTSDTTLTGTGKTVVSNSANNYIDSNPGAVRTLTIGNGYTVEGGGNLGAYSNQLKVVNQGTVLANAAGGMNVSVNDSNSTVGFNNSTGQIQVADGSSLHLAGGTISGGTVQSLGNSGLSGGGTYENLTLKGVFNLSGGGTYSNVTNTGTLALNNGSSIYTTGTITNNGTMSLNASNATTTLLLTSDTTLTGTGKTVVSNSANNYIDSNPGAVRTLTIGNGYTVEGGGNLGAYSNQLKVVNQGTVLANAAGGMNVSVNDSNSTVGFNNSTGQIQVADGSSLHLAGGTISGGTITGTGSASLTGGGTYKDLALAAGSLQVANGQSLNTSGTITNNGSFTDNGTISLANNSVMANNGTFNLANNASLNAASGTFVNNGTLNITGNGTTAINAVFNNTSNGIVNDNAGNLLLAGGGVSSGNFAGAGNLTFSGGNYTLEGATIKTSNVSLTGGNLDFNLADVGKSSANALQVNGNLNLAGASLDLQGITGLTTHTGEFFDLVNVQGSISGTFNGLAEGASVAVNGVNFNLTYHGGTGNQIELVSNYTPSSVNYSTATPSNVAYVTGVQSIDTSTPQTVNLKGLDVLAGSSYTLGVNDTLNLNNGNGTLNVLQGAVFSGNGIIEGNVINAGLVRIPIVALPQVQGGYIQVIAPPAPSAAAGTAPAPVVYSNPVVIGASTVVAFIPQPATTPTNPTAAPVLPQPVSFVPNAPIITIEAPIVQVQGTYAVDASLQVTGNYTQTATGNTRLYVDGNTGASQNFSNTGGDYSQLFVGKAVTLDGSLQIVLQPELFSQFGYTPKIGDTFDFIIGSGGITLASGFKEQTFIDQAALGLFSGLNISPFSSGIASDPDKLFQISNNLFSFALIDGNTVLEATLIEPLTLNNGPTPTPTPVPSAIWMVASGILGLGAFRKKFHAQSSMSAIS